MVVARVIGNDATVAFGQTGSFLELNVMMPVTSVGAPGVDRAARGLGPQLPGAAASRALTATERGPQLVEQGLMLATALAPEIGYDAAAAMAKEALQERADDPRAGAREGDRARAAGRAPRPGQDDRARASAGGPAAAERGGPAGLTSSGAAPRLHRAAPARAAASACMPVAARPARIRVPSGVSRYGCRRSSAGSASMSPRRSSRASAA